MRSQRTPRPSCCWPPTSVSCRTTWTSRASCRSTACMSTRSTRRDEVDGSHRQLPAGHAVLSLGVDQRPQHLEDRSERRARLARAVARIARRSAVDRAVLLAAARAGRPGQRTEARRRDQVVARLCAAEARRTARCWRRRAESMDATSVQAERSPQTRPPSTAAALRRACTTRRSRRRIAKIDAALGQRASAYAQRAAKQRALLEAAGVPDHDHRLVPADRARSATRAASSRAASWTRPATRRRCSARSRAACASRKRWASTCSCTAKPSATTWSNTSANSSTATPSASSAGCSPTARAA